MEQRFILYRSKLKASICLISLVLFCTSFAFAQVKGKVTSQNGEALVGVSVSIKGVNRGTQTDAEGSYKLDVPSNSILVFSFVGYVAKDVTYTGQKEINVSLIIDEKLLNEIVVVGYGSQSKKEVTGAVQTIGYKELKDIPASQVTQKLQGQLAGVQINQATGKPE